MLDERHDSGVYVTCALDDGRHFSMAPGPHPRRLLTMMPRSRSAWPQALFIQFDVISVHVNTFRRVIALACILAIVVAGGTSAASDLLAIVLVPLDPLFGIVVAVPAPEADAAPLTSAPVLSVRTPRAPPLA